MTAKTLERRDVIIGTIIVVLLAGTFAYLGGKPLILTFVPVVFVTWIVFIYMYVKGTELPKGSYFLPFFLAMLAWQLIHFSEEFVTNFYTLFPELYGSAPYTPNIFVTFNMVAYFVFAIACILVFTRNIKFLLVPVLFFILYAGMGNVIAHTWWVILERSYFPGFYTAQVYWILGPLTLSALIGSEKNALIVMALIAAILSPLLIIFM
ncbi:MAG: hypothetical protein R3C44_15460 [Chloroflexota bacterium]